MNYGALRYQQQSGAYLSPRETEAMVLKRVNELLENAKGADARREALAKNYRLWALLLQGVEHADNPLPAVLKMDVVKVATWMLKATNAALNTVGSLREIIDINNDIISGLTGDVDAAPTRAALMTHTVSNAASPERVSFVG